jgi:phage terminase Nu1 subunit (DNA packaging protein)
MSRVAHCESPPAKMDKLDQALFDAHVKANEVQAYAQKKADEALDDLKKHVDEKAEELWELTKDKYISNAMIEAFELIVKIFGKW